MCLILIIYCSDSKFGKYQKIQNKKNDGRTGKSQCVGVVAYKRSSMLINRKTNKNPLKFETQFKISVFFLSSRSISLSSQPQTNSSSCLSLELSDSIKILPLDPSPVLAARLRIVSSETVLRS